MTGSSRLGIINNKGTSMVQWLEFPMRQSDLLEYHNSETTYRILWFKMYSKQKSLQQFLNQCSFSPEKNNTHIYMYDLLTRSKIMDVDWMLIFFRVYWAFKTVIGLQSFSKIEIHWSEPFILHTIMLYLNRIEITDNLIIDTRCNYT